MRKQFMTENQIILVQKTWKIFRSIQPLLVGDVFYSKLFMVQPEFRKMFPVAMDEQYRKLMDMISIVVARLERLNEVTDEIAALGKRHAGYGVKPEHYKVVGKALLWTLQQGLGSDWTKEVEEAWTKCYTIMSDAMIQAATEHTKNKI
ncbi:MAG TPA: globin domain-containing protein [Chitinophagaceae bacterium]|jgi:hemoglobin-like flavoprotein|nr:globin domain-containing protein [Chitinophagaceae bacterium]